MSCATATGCRCTALLVAAALAVGVPGCRHNRTNAEDRYPMSGKTIQQVQEEHTAAWMALPGVVGTAIGQCDGRPCILVLTAANTEQIRKQIPATVEGYPVVVQYTGEIRARDQ
jgi:outer membrane lipoprotein SlyB